MKGQKPERGRSQGRGARHERSAAKRASILDGSPSGGYKRQHRLQRAPLYIVEQGLRPAKSYENRSELRYAAARGGEIDDAMDKPRPIYCLIRSMRVERMIERRRIFPSGERR